MSNNITALVGSIQKFSTEDGPGIRTTVFLKGCPLHCRWCHNPEMISPLQEIIEMPNNCIHCGYCLKNCPKGAILFSEAEKRIVVDREKCDVCLECEAFCYAGALKGVARLMSPEEVMAEVEKDAGFYSYTGGGMTISGGEMLMHAEFTEELIKLAAEKGLGVCLDTCGFGSPEELKRLALYTNVTNILYDMKSIDDEIHKEYTGQSNALILENLRMLAGDERTRDKLIMRMPLMHGINDTWPIIEKTAVLYKELGIKKLTLLPYHDLGKNKLRHIGGSPEDFEAPSDEYVEELKAYFTEKAGMEVEILGKL